MQTWIHFVPKAALFPSRETLPLSFAEKVGSPVNFHPDLPAQERGLCGSVSCDLKERQSLQHEGGSLSCHTGSWIGRGQGHRAIWRSERLQSTAAGVRLESQLGKFFFFNFFKPQFPHL